MSIDTGNYSAKHWSLKAEQAQIQANKALELITEYKTQIENSLLNIQKVTNTFLRGITADTTEWVVIESKIGKSCFKNVKQIKKIWIPSTCEIIEAPSYLESPFYNCSEDCQIFTDVTDEDSTPVGWGNFWNYFSETEKLTVNYNSTIQDFNEYKIV